MNRINPLYLGLLLVVLLLLVSFKLSGAKTQLRDAKKSYNESAKLSTQLSELKKVYTKKINLNSFKSDLLSVKKTKTGVVLSSNTLDAKVLNSLMSKVLNGAYEVKKLKIKKLSETKASLYMEIKW